MIVERNFDCTTCRVTAKFLEVEKSVEIKVNGLSNTFDIKMMRCQTCGGETQTARQIRENAKVVADEKTALSELSESMGGRDES